MDQRFLPHLLLLILGLTTISMAQYDQKEEESLTGEHECSGNWICPSNEGCNQSLCRCKKDYYQCQKKGARYCRSVNKALLCPSGTLPPGSWNCHNHVCPKGKPLDVSYPCVPGYKKDGFECTDINECREEKLPCGSLAECKNTPGGFYCKCIKGFQKENTTEFCPSENRNENKCTDMDECSNSPGVCGSNFICRNSPGSYKCVCNEGFVNVSNTCLDMDECRNSPDVCGSNFICRNSPGSYKCVCNEGFVNVSNTCLDSQVKDKCEFSSSELKEKEQCDRMNPPDAICSMLQTAFAHFNSSCHSKPNVTKEEAKEQLQQVTEDLNDNLGKLANNFSITENRTEIGKIATNILKFVETAMLKSFIDTPRDQTIIQPKLSVSMKVSCDICTPGVAHFSLTLNDNLMEVPCPHGDRGPLDGAVFIVYQDLGSTLNESELFSPQVSEDYEVNSRVVTGAITSDLTSHVTFTLVHIQKLQTSNVRICVFWDPKKNGWSTDGCTADYSRSNDTHTTCSCNHLSSFAVLMAPFGHEDNLGLTILSKIGLSLSAVCLALSLLTFIICRSLRSAHTSVLTTLCSCLFLGQVLFLVGLHQTSCRVACSIIAGGLHFLFLCAFCWMSIESILLFMTVRNLRAVNYMTSRRSNFPVMCLLGFGVPAVIVGVSAAIQPEGYGTENYCWLQPQTTIWSFLGPIAVIVITNTTLLLFTVILLRIRLVNLNTNVSTLKNNRILTFKALAQLFILGCTWGIGFFQFHRSGSLVISYIFTICNSLQGVYIFLVHCVFNNQVRQEYRKLFGRARKHVRQSSDEATPHTSGRTMNLTEITKPGITEQSSGTEYKVNWK